MSPKKAIVIVFVLFFIVAILFVILVDKKPATSPNANLDNQTEKTEVKGEPVKPEEIIEEKVNKIIEDAKDNPNSNPETVRQEIISTINAEIIKQEESKTPEQKAADLKEQEERQRIIDEINDKIRQAE